MKKLLIFTVLAASFIFVAPAAEAKTTTAVGSSSAMNQPRLWRGRRVTTTSRLVRVGNRLYRDTYRIRYNRFGRVVSRQLVSRIRIR